MKEFFKSPKKTAILGLVGSILITIIPKNIDYGFLYNIFDIYALGIMVYFIIICMRLYKNMGNIKIANYVLIVTYCISTIFYIFMFIRYIGSNFFLLTNFNQYLPLSIMSLALLFHIFILVVSVVYLCNILLHKIKLPINNKILFVIAIFCIIKIICFCVIYIDRSSFNLLDTCKIIADISYLLILPYFYNYYSILKGEE